MKLIVMPSKKLWYTGIALAGTCVVGAIIVGALHIYEKVKKRLFCSVVWTERRLIFHELILRSIEKDSQVYCVGAHPLYCSEPATIKHNYVSI